MNLLRTSISILRTAAVNMYAPDGKRKMTIFPHIYGLVHETKPFRHIGYF